MTDRMLPLPDMETPLAVKGQPLPQAGGNVFGVGMPPMLIPAEKLIAAGLWPEDIGTYVWMAQRQADYRPITTSLVAEWLARPDNSEHTGEPADTRSWARMIVRRLGEANAIYAEPDQYIRLAAVRAERDELVSLFAEPPDPPRRTARRQSEPATPVQSAADDAAAVVTNQHRHEPAEDGHWYGVWPISARGHYPAKGQNVVYLLRADNDLVVYVGSTNHFIARMKAHRGAGKRWGAWEAIPCDSRDEAYDVESEYMAIHMPHLNVAGPRGGES